MILMPRPKQAYRPCHRNMPPHSPEAVFRYVTLLLTQQRFADAIPVAEAAVNAAPDSQQFRDLLEALKKKSAGR